METQHENKPYGCDKCNARFKHQSSLSRHISKVHVDEKNENNTPSHNINSNSLTEEIKNENTFISIHPFGKENISHILKDEDFLTRCLRKVMRDGIPALVDKIYFDPAFPGNQNTKLKRMRKPATLMVYVAEDDHIVEWKEKELFDILDTIITRCSDILVKHNYYLYKISKQGRNEEEMFFHRAENLSKVRSKKRGVYGKIRDGVYLKFINHKKLS